SLSPILRPPSSPLFPYTPLFRSTHPHPHTVPGVVPAPSCTLLLHACRVQTQVRRAQPCSDRARPRASFCRASPCHPGSQRSVRTPDRRTDRRPPGVQAAELRLGPPASKPAKPRPLQLRCDAFRSRWRGAARVGVGAQWPQVGESSPHLSTGLWGE